MGQMTNPTNDVTYLGHFGDDFMGQMTNPTNDVTYLTSGRKYGIAALEINYMPLDLL